MHGMPRGIAIETSGRIGSIALVEDARLLAEEPFPHGLQHAAQIVPIIDRLTRALGWSPRDIQELYISIGPGSFTGLRIGVTVAKAMALATGVKIVAAPTLRVLVENAPDEARHVLMVLDAKRDQIFTALYERGNGGWHEREPAHLDALAPALARAPRPVYLLGEGISYHRRLIPADDSSVIVTHEDSWRARAAAVGKIGAQLAARGEFADPLALAPIYIRPPEAEEKFAARQTGLA